MDNSPSWPATEQGPVCWTEGFPGTLLNLGKSWAEGGGGSPMQQQDTFGTLSQVGQDSDHQISLVALVHLTLWSAEDRDLWGLLLGARKDRAAAPPGLPAGLPCASFLFWAQVVGSVPILPSPPHNCQSWASPCTPGRERPSGPLV